MLNRKSKIKNQKSGFTLLEILIAMFIFAVVVTTVFGSFNSVVRGVDAVTVDLDIYDMAKNCINRMVLDLQSVYVPLPPEFTPPQFNDPPTAYRIVGDAYGSTGDPFGRLRFASLAHLSFGPRRREGIAQIVYYVQTTQDGRNLLRRADHLYPYPEFEERPGDPVLCEEVKKIVFTFYDTEGTEYDRWSSDSDQVRYATPHSVGIRLELGDEERSFFFETRVPLPMYREKIG
jgi:general secretion pathway protein J